LAEVVALSEEAGLTELTERARQLDQSLTQPVAGDPPNLEVDVQSGVAALQRILELRQRTDDGPAAAPSLPGTDEHEPLSLADDPEAVGDFVMEAREHLEVIDRGLIKLEAEHGPMDLIHDLFRRFHTLKGLAGFLELPPVRDLAHAVEELLSAVRESAVDLSPALTELLFEATDQLRRDVDAVEAGLRARSRATLGDRTDLIGRLSRLPSCEAVEAAEHSADPEESPATGDEAPTKRIAATRVDPAKLDHLAELAGELLVAQSQVAHAPEIRERPDGVLAGKMLRFSRLTQEIQASAMSLRMVPVEQLFDRTARLVRDLARRCGKKVRLQTVGGETAVDRAVVELLADPMLHLVRNALDHGIEEPDVRCAAGKPEEGLLTLEASHHAGQVLIEIRDDGRGLDRDQIRKKAEERGLIEPIQDLSPSEIDDLIFQPGFTTTPGVTDLSGRGVGMDVVRKHLVSLRGWVDVSSEDGQGVRIQMFIPLTLALIEGLTVAVGEERYVAPLAAVQEVVQPAPAMISTIEGRYEAATVRDELYPILRLARHFGFSAPDRELTEMFLVLARVGKKKFALAVDSFLGTQDVIIKSVATTADGRTTGISGGTILGDGRVALILDLESLAEAA